MLRRNFLSGLTTLGVGSLAALASVEAGKTAGGRTSREPGASATTVSYAVTGFTCITCAVGLETLLRQEEGVLAASANYRAATATVTYDPSKQTQASLKRFIEGAGFAARAIESPRT